MKEDKIIEKTELDVITPMVEVAFQSRAGDKIRCDTCPIYCTLEEGEIGTCSGRQVINGKFIATNYAQISSLRVEPIEKKPLYHFYPGSEIVSIGPNGCNLSCSWCQNWPITQNLSPTRVIMPSEMADIVDSLDGIGIAYTFAEPLIWYEYVRDVGRIMHERGLLNVFITNGYVNTEPLRELLKIADAFNVDLKSSEDSCYRDHCGGRIEDVHRTIRHIHDSGKHIEISHILVSSVSTELKKVEQLVDWIALVDTQIPLHLTRYIPANHYNEPPTDMNFIDKAYDIAKSKLQSVYLNGMSYVDGQDSICPSCGEVLVKRGEHSTELLGLNGNNCQTCGSRVYFQNAD